MRSKLGLIRMPPHTPMADQPGEGLCGVFGNGLHAASVRSPTLSKPRHLPAGGSDANGSTCLSVDRRSILIASGLRSSISAGVPELA